MTCEHCDGSGWTFPEATNVATPCPCGAALRNHVTDQVRRSRFSRAFLGAGGTIKPWRAESPEQRAALAVVERWAATFDPGTPGLWLAGPCGVGKSHLAALALFGVFSRGFTGAWWNVADMLAEVQATFNGPGSEDQVLFEAYASDCAVLDDLGATRGTDWELALILRLLNNRIENNRTTIVTTNLTIEQARVNLGERITSRIYDIAPESNKIVAKWNDFRQVKHKGQQK